jgi:hypothetical protein
MAKKVSWTAKMIRMAREINQVKFVATNTPRIIPYPAKRTFRAMSPRASEKMNTIAKAENMIEAIAIRERCK